MAQSPPSNGSLRQLHTHELEIGATEAVQKHFSRHVVDARPVSQRKLDFEHSRPRWLREMMAEATGVFFYVFPGIAAITAFTINKEDAAFGSILQIGFAFAFGIAFAIITCASTSGGHFNPAITICFAVWQGFPWKKVPYYIFAQVFGAFMAGLLLMGMYWEQLGPYAAATRAAGEGVVFNGGAASVLCAFPSENQSLGYLFLIEFFVDSYIVSPRMLCINEIGTNHFAGHRHLVCSRPCKSIRGSGLCTLRDRSSLRCHDLGFRGHHDQHQLGP